MRLLWERTPVPVENVAGIGAGLLLHGLKPLRAPRRLVPIGWFLVVLGTAGIVRSVRERGPGDIQNPERLTTSGLHGMTRNPMYVGWGLLHLGLGLVGRAGWVVATWPFASASIHRLIMREEAELLVRFPEEFDAYRVRVPRYLNVGGLRSGNARRGGDV
jgi:protein-S-isoprenylcysteine O-methyltransferase Ste14